MTDDEFVRETATVNGITGPATPVTIFVVNSDASCTSCNVSGLSLAGMSLTGTNFSGANLTGPTCRATA